MSVLWGLERCLEFFRADCLLYSDVCSLYARLLSAQPVMVLGGPHVPLDFLRRFFFYDRCMHHQGVPPVRVELCPRRLCGAASQWQRLCLVQRSGYAVRERYLPLVLDALHERRVRVMELLMVHTAQGVLTPGRTLPLEVLGGFYSSVHSRCRHNREILTLRTMPFMLQRRDLLLRCGE